jgi:hypothetical protein
MNPRRVHQLMLNRFPAFDTVDFDWENMHDGKAPLLKELSELLLRYIEAPEVLVEVHRKLGALLPIDDAVAFIGSHIGEGQIRVADRQFTSFVVVALNGVAAGWRMTDNGSLGTDRQLKSAASRPVLPAGQLER